MSWWPALGVRRGVHACAVAGSHGRHRAGPAAPRWPSPPSFGALLAATWIWPITFFVDGESDGDRLRRGVPRRAGPARCRSAMTVLVFAFVTVTAQAIKRRPLVKSIFNAGQVHDVGRCRLHSSSRCCAAHPRSICGYVDVLAALVGRRGYFVVNTTAHGVDHGDIRHAMASNRPWWPEGQAARHPWVASASPFRRPSCWTRDPVYLPVAVLPVARRALPRHRRVLRPARPGPPARLVRGDPRREPVDGHGGDEVGRPQRRRVVVALAGGHVDGRPPRRRGRVCRRR